MRRTHRTQNMGSFVSSHGNLGKVKLAGEIKEHVRKKDQKTVLALIKTEVDLGKRRIHILMVKNLAIKTKQPELAIEVVMLIADNKERNIHLKNIYSQLADIFEFSWMLVVINHIDEHETKVRFLNEIINHCRDKEGCFLEEQERKELDSKATKMLEKIGGTFIKTKKYSRGRL